MEVYIKNMYKSSLVNV